MVYAEYTGTVATASLNSFQKYLSAYYVPAIILGTKDIAVNKVTPSPHRVYVLLVHILSMAHERKSKKNHN